MTLVFSNHLLLKKILDVLTIRDLESLAKVAKVVYRNVKYYISIRKTFNFSKWNPSSVQWPKHGLQFFIFKNTNIRELDFTNCGKWLSDAFLTPLVQQNKQLKKLSLRSCHSKRITDSSMLAIVKNCAVIEELILDDCSWFTPNTFSLVGGNCKLLKILSLRSCYSIDDQSLAAVLKSCLHLRELHLRHCRQIGGEILDVVGESCKELRVLDFSRCSQVSDVTALRLVTGCKFIEDLNLTQTSLSNWSFRLIGNAYGNSLRSARLAATEVDDDVIENIAVTNQNRLKTIDLSFCKRIRDGALKALSETCQKLRILDLTACPNLSGKGIEAIGRNCRLLTELTLEDCPWLKSETLLLLATRCKYLKKVNVKGCGQIEDRALIAMAKKNNALESLNISGCHKTTTSAIRSLVFCCSGINELAMGDCIAVDDLGLRHLALSKEITHIDMDGCSVLSAKTLAKIGSNCKKIRRLSLSGCNKINSRSLVTVVVNNPKLEYIDITSCFTNPTSILAVVKTFNKNVFVDC